MLVERENHFLVADDFFVDASLDHVDEDDNQEMLVVNFLSKISS